MPNYKAVSWKRNLNKVPDFIRDEIAGLDTDIFYAGVTKVISAADIASGEFDHLNLPTEVDAESRFIPAAEMGAYSTKNRDGWVVVRKNLPKIVKTFSWESPNFGDASTYGTHTHFQDREVYQREWYDPRDYELSVRLLRQLPNDDCVYLIRVATELSRADAAQMAELLLMLNLLQENCGANGVVASNVRPADYLKTMSLDWTIFPPGNIEDVISSMTSGMGGASLPPHIVRERVELFARLKPKAYLRGTAGFGSYIGAQYADDLVVFENVRYGNALYILYENWKNVSRRSRIDLIRGTDAHFDRLVHNVGWTKLFNNILTREKRKRGL